MKKQKRSIYFKAIPLAAVLLLSLTMIMVYAYWTDQIQSDCEILLNRNVRVTVEGIYTGDIDEEWTENEQDAAGDNRNFDQESQDNPAAGPNGGGNAGAGNDTGSNANGDSSTDTGYEQNTTEDINE